MSWLGPVRKVTTFKFPDYDHLMSETTWSQKFIPCDGPQAFKYFLYIFTARYPSGCHSSTSETNEFLLGFLHSENEFEKV